MSAPLNYVYLISTLPLCVIWMIIFFLRKDLRREMLSLSFLIAIVSVLTSYFWWTVDWWQPPTIWGTKVGIEDFISGFASGGIMAVIYEVVFKKKLYRRKKDHYEGRGLIILLILAQITSWLFWGVGLSSFTASSIAMIATSLIILSVRRDLFFNALGSGVLLLLAVLPSYYLILLIHPLWMDVTYSMLSGFRPAGIPIEELIFWFLAGFLWGPFYEYWHGGRLRSIS